MTLGQRVAQKRKELGLSQEGLGEKLGVSRQAIYKWESDASTPEVDKLIALSKIFSVSVGWLLGVEEEGPEGLTQDQEKLVEEVLSRYQAAQPAPQRSAWDKWSVRILFALCGVMLALLVGTSTKVKEMEQHFSNSIWQVEDTVDRQINSITRRVEDILKSQNALTADWSAQLASTDLAANTAIFDVRVVPKTYVEGMTAIFQAQSGEETVELPVEPGADHAFAGQIACPLTDHISLTVVFVTGDKRETQWLEDHDGLYKSSFPDLTMRSGLWRDLREAKDDILPPVDWTKPAVNRSEPAKVWNHELDNPFLGWKPEPPAQIQVGLFRDQELVMWYEGRTETTNWDGVPTEEYFWYRPGEVALEPGHEYCEAAVYTDEYGRQMVYPTSPEHYPQGDGADSPSRAYESMSDPADWTF